MKPSGIGGQAVIEGIMMKNKDKYSIAVRKPDNDIEITVRECNNLSDKYTWLNYPIIRGIYNFADSLVTGISTINYSASFFDDPAEQKSTKVDELGKTVFKDKLEAVLMAFTVILSIVLAVGLFMLIPYFVSRLLAKVIASQFLLNFVEGIVRVVIFILYIVAISCMKDIKRTFMYHGAEHKCINCIEHGTRLTPENVKNSSRLHKRCGTSFLFIVMFISVLFFIFIQVDNTALQLVLRIFMVPVIAGVSYEVIRWAGRNESPAVEILSKPGLWLQKLTTREPDMDMIEVAIKAVEEVFDWKAFLLEYYKDSEEPEAEMAANEAALALTGTVKTNADKKTRSINPDEIVQEAAAPSTQQQTPEYTVTDNTFIQEYEAGDESESTVHDVKFEENEAAYEDDDDSLPDGFEIIEDDDTYDNALRSKEDILKRNDWTEEKEQAAEEALGALDSAEALGGSQGAGGKLTAEAGAKAAAGAAAEMLEAASQEQSDAENEQYVSDGDIDDEDDGFEFIEDDEDDIDCADDLPIFKQRADKKR